MNEFTIFGRRVAWLQPTFLSYQRISRLSPCIYWHLPSYRVCENSDISRDENQSGLVVIRLVSMCHGCNRCRQGIWRLERFRNTEGVCPCINNVWMDADNQYFDKPSKHRALHQYLSCSMCKIIRLFIISLTKILNLLSCSLPVYVVQVYRTR